MPDAYKNFSYSTVATAPSPATSGTSLVVASGEGANFPAAPFNAVIWPTATALPTAANAEIVRVTVKSTDTFTITRAQESTTARTVVVGDQIMAAITAKVLTDLSPSYGTAFPGSPIDGAEHVLVDSTTVPTFQWHFRYNAGSSNTDKWEFIGGIPVYKEVLTDQSTTSSTFTDLATTGPTFTIPVGGLYEIRHGANIYFGSGAPAAGLQSIRVAAVTATDDDAAEVGIASNGLGVSAMREIRRTCAASDVVKTHYRCSTGTANFRRRWIAITPVRCS